MNKKDIFLYMLSNIVVFICFTFISIKFEKWWIILFSIFFMYIPSYKKTIKRKYYYRICDKCGKHSTWSSSYDEAFTNAHKEGWISFEDKEHEKVMDLCPECQKRYGKEYGEKYDELYKLQIHE